MLTAQEKLRALPRVEPSPSRGSRTLTPAARTDVETIAQEFLSRAGHELRTPLTSILGYSELLLSQDAGGDGDSDSQQEYLELIIKNAQKLQHIVDTLMDVDRLQSGQGIRLNKTPCKIESLVVDTLLTFQDQPGRQFLMRLSEGQTVLRADKEKLTQVLGNLVCNALNFSSDTPVCVRGDLDDNVYRLCVEDQGIGMTPEEVERVFDPFYRVDTSNSAPEGLGLGLSWAKGVMDGHGGEIQVESEPGKGTRVTLLLPVNS